MLCCLLFRRGAINAVQLNYLQSYIPQRSGKKCSIMWQRASHFYKVLVHNQCFLEFSFDFCAYDKICLFFVLFLQSSHRWLFGQQFVFTPSNNIIAFFSTKKKWKLICGQIAERACGETYIVNRNRLNFFELCLINCLNNIFFEILTAVVIVSGHYCTHTMFGIHSYLTSNGSRASTVIQGFIWTIEGSGQ